MTVDGNRHLDAIDEPTTHHEESDVNIRAIFLFTAGLIAVAVVVHLAVWGMFVFFEERESGRVPEFPMAVTTEPRVPPAPRLQERPREDLQQFLAREDAILNGYSWVDRQAGIVRIPIAGAMKRTVGAGLPVRPAEEPKP